MRLRKSNSASWPCRDVKDFGQRIIHDDSAMFDELKRLAVSKGVDVDEPPSNAIKSTKNRLNSMPSDQFDNAYVAEILKSRRANIAEFSRERKAAGDNDLRRFTVRTVAHITGTAEASRECDSATKACEIVASQTKPSYFKLGSRVGSSLNRHESGADSKFCHPRG
jgi:predicted outer membrane protein